MTKVTTPSGSRAAEPAPPARAVFVPAEAEADPSFSSPPPGDRPIDGLLHRRRAHDAARLNNESIEALAPDARKTRLREACQAEAEVIVHGRVRRNRFVPWAKVAAIQPAYVWFGWRKVAIWTVDGARLRPTKPARGYLLAAPLPVTPAPSESRAARDLARKPKEHVRLGFVGAPEDIGTAPIFRGRAALGTELLRSARRLRSKATET
jgi:hypothetical protein